MATVDQVAGTEEVPVASRPAAPSLPPPPPGAQPVTAADGTAVRRTTRRTVKRRPIPRGTAAISGGAVAGTLLTVVYAAAGPLALVATAAGAVLIPLAVWRRHANSRTGRRAVARRGARRREGGRRGAGWTSPRGSRSGGGLGLGNPLAGLGGGGGRGRGSRSTGRSLFGAGAGGRGRGGRGSGNPWSGLGLGIGGKKTGAAGARSGGMPKSTRRGAGSRTVGGRNGSQARQVTPKVGRGAGRNGGVTGRAPSRGGAGGGWKPPKGTAPKNNTPKGSTPKAPKNNTPKAPRGGAGGWKPPTGSTSGRPNQTSPAKTVKTPPAATAAGGTNPPAPKAKKVKKTTYGPRGRGGQYGAWTPPRRATRSGTLATAANHGLWRAGSAFLHGVRKPGARRAFRATYRRYGAHGYNPTVTGYLGRVAGGVAAAVPAWLARLAWIAAKKLAASIRQAYNPPAPAPAAQPQAQQRQQQPTQQQHPVPGPAFAGPSPARSNGSRPSPHPRQPAPTGGGAAPNQHGGSTPMATVFPPHGPAADFLKTCITWSPAAEGTDRAIWRLHDALPYMVGSVGMIANGWANVIAQCELGLLGALHPAMRSAMSDVHKPLNAAANNAAQLIPTFNKVYADAIARRSTRGGAALNV